MTTLEAYNLIKNRVEWKGSLNTDFNFLTPLVPESGRYLQEEHTSVRIPIIYETIVSVDIDNADFETVLEDIKKRAILQMLHDVFYDRKDIKEKSRYLGDMRIISYVDYLSKYIVYTIQTKDYNRYEVVNVFNDKEVDFKATVLGFKGNKALIYRSIGSMLFNTKQYQLSVINLDTGKEETLMIEDYGKNSMLNFQSYFALNLQNTYPFKRLKLSYKSTDLIAT